MNTQPIIKVDNRSDGTALSVHSIFYTIQGEGPYAGMAAVFIRLAGCNLQCPGCDTEYTHGAKLKRINDIVDDVDSAFAELKFKTALVVITGGEPFRQPIAKLVKCLLHKDYSVQIETNGTLYQELPWNSDLTIVCSPKTGSINPKLLPHIDALKYVAKAGELAADGLPTNALGHSAHPILARPPIVPNIPVYLQPMDEKDEEFNRKNMEAVRDSCLKNGYIFCIQLHKIIGVD